MELKIKSKEQQMIDAFEEYIRTKGNVIFDYGLEAYMQVALNYIHSLEQENQELNKENDRLAAKLNKNKILQNEFRKWLENESKELIRDAGYHQRICLDILEKYKEIIGGKE